MASLKKIIKRFKDRIGYNKKVFKENFIYLDGKRIFNTSKCPYYNLDITGKGNRFYLQKANAQKDIYIKCEGDNNYLEIGKNNRIVAGLTVFFVSIPGKKVENTKIIIGDNNIFNGYVTVQSPVIDGNAVKIGSNNLFAGGVNIKGLSDHLIYDIKTKERLNPETGVTIKDNIWICENVLVLNKANIPSNSVVAARSTVNKPFFEQNILLAGTPAEIKKKDIMWHIRVDDEYIKDSNPLSSW